MIGLMMMLALGAHANQDHSHAVAPEVVARCNAAMLAQARVMKEQILASVAAHVDGALADHLDPEELAVVRRLRALEAREKLEPTESRRYFWERELQPAREAAHVTLVAWAARAQETLGRDFRKLGLIPFHDAFGRIALQVTYRFDERVPNPAVLLLNFGRTELAYDPFTLYDNAADTIRAEHPGCAGHGRITVRDSEVYEIGVTSLPSRAGSLLDAP